MWPIFQSFLALLLLFQSAFVKNYMVVSYCFTGKITHQMAWENKEEFVNRMFEEYDGYYRPPEMRNCSNRGENVRQAPTVVLINIYVISFGSIDVQRMEYTVDLFLRQRWTDSRLQYQSDITQLSLSYMRHKIWVPDLFFRNAKHGIHHDVTKPNYLLWVWPNGEVLYSQKLTLKLTCPMQLHKFPFDTQKCRMNIGSYGYKIEDLDFRWQRSMSSPIVLDEKLQLNEFSRPQVQGVECSRQYNSTGSFACINVEFLLKRKFGFYLIYTFAPSILVVVVSWITFWIDSNAVPARISLGLLSILALITEAGGTLGKLPPVSYIKAIDIWLFTCLAFVVATLLESAFVNVSVIRQKPKRRVIPSTRNLGPVPHFTDVPTCGDSVETKEMRFLIRQEFQPVLTLLLNLHTSRDDMESPRVREQAAIVEAWSVNDTSPLRNNNDLIAEDGDSEKKDDQHGQRRKNSYRACMRDRFDHDIQKHPNFASSRLDYFSMMIFPAVFLAFNVIFWLHFF